MDDRLRVYLFEQHSISEIQNWYERLKYFRYFRAYGGHANDGDSLDFAVSYRKENELNEIFSCLGLKIEKFDREPQRPKVGKRYTSKEFERFPSLVPGTKWIKQPGRCSINGNEAFVWATDDRVILSAGCGHYEVTDDTVDCAERIEQSVNLIGFKDRIVDPPKDTLHYISPMNHPNEFSEQGSSSNGYRRATL